MSDKDKKHIDAATKATERLAAAQEKANRLVEEGNKERAKAAGYTKSHVNDMKDWSNILNSIMKNEKYSNQEKRKALSIDKKLLDLAEKTYTFDLKGLGTTSKSEKIQKAILKNEQNRRILGLQINRIGKDGSKIQYAANEAIQKQIESAGRVTEELERQASAAREIEGSKVANTFGATSKLLSKIPLLSEFSGGFKQAEEAAREAGAEVTLFSKGMVDASEYSIKGLQEKFGEGARVEFTMDQDHVDDLEQKAAEAQAKIDKGGLKKGKVEELQKVVKKGGDAKVGKKYDVHGAAAKAALESGSGKLKGVNKQLIEMLAGFKKIGKEIGKMVGLLILKSMFDANKQIIEVSKNLGLGVGEAIMLNVQLNFLADTSNDLLVNQRSIRQALTELNTEYGTAVVFNDETLTTSAKILHTKVMDGKATANLSAMSRINGQTLKGSLQTQEDAVNAVNQEYNTRISLKVALNEANKITGQIRAQLAANPAAIQKAVVKAKALGMELQTVAAAGKQMLDFESSIEAELTAELMLGRQLNLEKARLAALTGDYETLTEEINKNVGDFGDFTKLNVLQQDALAASMGMSTDALSDQLMKKANLEELAKEAMDRGEKQHAADLMRLNTQQKFEEAVLKVKDAFVSLGVILQPIAFTIGIVAEAMGTWPGMIAAAIVGLVQLIKWVRVLKILSIGDAIARIWGATFGTLGPIAGPAVAIASTAALFMAISKAASKAGDVMSPADGKTQISTKEGGLFELSKNDDVAAGPGILDKLKGMASGGLSGLAGLFSGGGISIIEPLISAFDNLTTLVTSKFDQLIKTIIEKQGEGNNIQKSTSEDLTTNLSTLAAVQNKNESIHKKLAMGMVAASMGIFGMGTTAGIASDVISDTNTIKTEQEQTIENPIEGKSPSDVSAQLDAIKKAIEDGKNITINVQNKLAYDAFADNTVTNYKGKEMQEKINDSSFL